MLVHGLPALGLGEMLAIRGRPQQAHRPSGADLHGIDIPHTGLNVLSARVIRLVHEYRVRVVVDSDIDRPPGCQLNARRRSAASGKAVDYEFIRHAYHRAAHALTSNKLICAICR